MITTQTLPYRGSKALADELNKESARHYNATLSNHWRTFRKKGVWLSEKSAYRWEDYQSDGTILHAHSRDAAQQAFYRSCKTARTLKRNGNTAARYPKYRRGFRTTIWKNTGIRKSGSTLLLARAGAWLRSRWPSLPLGRPVGSWKPGLCSTRSPTSTLGTWCSKTVWFRQSHRETGCWR